MKKSILWIGLLVLLLSICGCDSEAKGVSMTMIQSDIESYDYYAMLAVETDTVEIIKRQTNFESKEDLVYVTIRGKNEYYEVVRNYKLRYLLYNDGWILEELTSYSDDNCHDITTPLQSISKEDVIACLEEWNLAQYTSFDTEYIRSINYSDVEEVSAEMRENYGCINYTCTVRYTYHCFDEIITLPIVCSFSTYTGGWDVSFDKSGISRTAVLNEGILGTWTGRDVWSTTVKVSIFSYDSDGCEVDYHTQLSRDRNYYSEGEMYLDVNYYEGEISGLLLKWSDGKVHDRCYSIWLDIPIVASIVKGYTLSTSNGVGDTIYLYKKSG